VRETLITGFFLQHLMADAFTLKMDLREPYCISSSLTKAFHCFWKHNSWTRPTWKLIQTWLLSLWLSLPIWKNQCVCSHITLQRFMVSMGIHRLSLRTASSLTVGPHPSSLNTSLPPKQSMTTKPPPLTTHGLFLTTNSVHEVEQNWLLTTGLDITLLLVMIFSSQSLFYTGGGQY